MTLEELKEFNGHPVTDEQLEEIRKCEFSNDIIDNGLSPMYPALTWYIILLTDGQEVHVFA